LGTVGQNYFFRGGGRRGWVNFLSEKGSQIRGLFSNIFFKEDQIGEIPYFQLSKWVRSVEINSKFISKKGKGLGVFLRNQKEAELWQD
jgi:hypothetical protein